MASWRVEPERAEGTWACFRQTSPDAPPLYHNAGAPRPDQESARWHRHGECVAQYFSCAALGAWAEYGRYFTITSAEQAAQQRRNLWQVWVAESDIADLSTFDRWEHCGLDPARAVDEQQEGCRDLGARLREAGYRGVLSPSAALPNVTNLTVFGERYERIVNGATERWRNPNRDVWLPVALLAEQAPVPVQLCTNSVFLGQPHPGYQQWRAEAG